MFATPEQPTVYLSRSDASDPLSSHSRHGFRLDDADWPSVEHYYQAMKFDDPQLREAIRSAPDPQAAAGLAKQHRRRMRPDWKSRRRALMTRGVYVKCRSHPEAAAALLATTGRRIVETSQYDYFWGCGRDLRGENAYGQVLMNVRERLLALGAEGG